MILLSRANTRVFHPSHPHRRDTTTNNIICSSLLQQNYRSADNWIVYVYMCVFSSTMQWKFIFDLSLFPQASYASFSHSNAKYIIGFQARAMNAFVLYRIYYGFFFFFCYRFCEIIRIYVCVWVWLYIYIYWPGPVCSRYYVRWQGVHCVTLHFTGKTRVLSQQKHISYMNIIFPTTPTHCLWWRRYCKGIKALLGHPWNSIKIVFGCGYVLRRSTRYAQQMCV